MQLILRSMRVLGDDVILPADIVIDHDYISEVLPYGSAATAVDLGERLIVPGFVDLHSDAVEKEIEPRPGAEFPVENALVELDKKLAMSGITTMFHAISFNDESLVGQRGTEAAATLIRTLAEFNSQRLSIDNLTHARYEITSLSSMPVIRELIAAGQIQLLSLMDHSPGQGQFRTLEKWKEYYVPVFKLSDQDVSNIVNAQHNKKNHSLDYLHELTSLAAEHGILLASHDDDTPAKVDFMENLGISIAEFPLNLETAEHARNRRMATGMGAPNIVRGKSQSGNISARQLVEHNCCDFLCSDYHPTSMLQAVYAMHREMKMDLAQAMAFITSTPARVARLQDRGRIAPHQLADLAVIEDRHVAKVVLTIKAGTPVYSGSGCLCLQPA